MIKNTKKNSKLAAKCGYNSKNTKTYEKTAELLIS